MDRSDRHGRSRAWLAWLALLGWAVTAGATPSSTNWTPATTDVQGFRVLHVGVDNYFTVFRKAGDRAGDFPTDVGLTVGVLPYQRFQMEIGIDTLEPSDFPVFFNAKVGTPEGALFKGSPAVNLGVFNVGTEPGSTDQNIGHAMLGKTIPRLGRLFAGAYFGNDNLLVNAQGQAEATGFMVGFDRGIIPVTDAGGASYSRLVLVGDWASGKNAFGGGGVGVYWYFASTVSLLNGVVWFNEEAINGPWKWTTQLDVNVPF